MNQRTPNEIAEEYFQKLQAGYNRLSDGSLDARSFEDLSPLFFMAKDFYQAYCIKNDITPRSFLELEPLKKQSKLRGLFSKHPERP